MARRLGVAGLVAVLVGSTAHAQGFGGGDVAEERPIRFGIAGGVVVPRSGARFQDVLAGPTGQAFMLIRLVPGLPALRIGADYSRTTFGEPTAGVQASVLGVTRTQFGGLMSLRFDLGHGPVQPYVVGGVGAFSIRDKLDVAGSLSAGNAISATEFGLDGGAGLSLRLGRISAFAEARIQNVSAREGLINTTSIRNIPVTFGLMF